MQQFREHYGQRDGAIGDEPAGLTRRDKPGGSSRAAKGKRRAGLSESAHSITQWDILYYVYGLLHHPGYRTKFADKLKRELPDIPFAPDF